MNLTSVTYSLGQLLKLNHLVVPFLHLDGTEKTISGGDVPLNQQQQLDKLCSRSAKSRRLASLNPPHIFHQNSKVTLSSRKT
ncbi:hypothetical protein ACFX13_014482 [Malus domestica]